MSADIPGWDALAGYTEVKQDIEDTLVMPLQYPVGFEERDSDWSYLEIKLHVLGVRHVWA